VALGVCSVKALGEAGAESNRELERLPRVAEVGLALVGESSYVRERRDVRLNGVDALVRSDEPARREQACGGRHEHRLAAELLGEGAGVQRPRAAEGDQG